MKKFSDFIPAALGVSLKQVFRGIWVGTRSRIYVPVTVLKQSDSRFK